MAQLKIMHIVGTRPNFPKVAPVMAEMAKQPDRFTQLLIHTGQHYDYNMSQVFFEDLEMSVPDDFLNVGSGTHAVQTANVMIAFEPLLLKYSPDWVFVVGDVNSTLGCALVCAKLGIRVAHIEAGLRSRDRSMPEEVNRVLTDQISDLLFTPSPDADQNLINEGIEAAKIHFVGNVMIDTLVKMLPRAMQRPVLEQNGLKNGNYVLATLHRPSNVDNPAVLRELVMAMLDLSGTLPVIFPVHPRTRGRIQDLSLNLEHASLRLIEPLGYLDFLALMHGASLVITDSGGVQEETTYLGIPCLTARPNTERPVTITKGTNQLVASRREELFESAREALRAKHGPPSRPPLWDGMAASRIREVISSIR